MWIREIACLLWYVLGRVDNELSWELYFIFPFRKHLLSICFVLGSQWEVEGKSNMNKIQHKLQEIYNFLQLSEASWQWQQLTVWLFWGGWLPMLTCGLSHFPKISFPTTWCYRLYVRMETGRISDCYQFDTFSSAFDTPSFQSVQNTCML